MPADRVPSSEQIRDDLMEAASYLADLGNGETVYAITRFAEDHAASAERLRWLSEHVSDLLEDRARVEWLEQRAGKGCVAMGWLRAESSMPDDVVSYAVPDGFYVNDECGPILPTLREAIDSAREGGNNV